MQQQVNDEDERVRTAAINVLSDIGRAARELSPLLIERLKDDSDRVRQSAIQALGDIEAPAEDAVPAIIATLAEKRRVRIGDVRSCAQAIGIIGRSDVSSVDQLTEFLKDPRPSVRMLAAEALREMGPSAANAVPELIASLT